MNAPARAAGRNARCPKCQHVFKIPATETAPPPQPKTARKPLTWLIVGGTMTCVLTVVLLAVVIRQPAEPTSAVVAPIAEPEADYDQMTAPREVLHGLTQDERLQFYKDYLAADSRAFKEGREKYPTYGAGVISIGDSFTLTEEAFMISHKDPVEWLEDGMKSLDLPPGTKIEVLRIAPIGEDALNIEVVAWLPGSSQGIRGWVREKLLMSQHPIVKDKKRSREQSDLQREYIEDLKAVYIPTVLQKYGVDEAIAEQIIDEGFAKKWPSN